MFKLIAVNFYRQVFLRRVKHSVELFVSRHFFVIVFFCGPGEDVKDLLERGLGRGVLLDLELLPDIFHHAEDEPD